MRPASKLCIGILALLALAASGYATPVVTSSVTFLSPSEVGNPRAASATFQTVDNASKGKKSGTTIPYLRVTLTNTSPFDVADPPEVLMAVFFDVQNEPTFTGGSAALASGSQVLFEPTFTGTDLSGTRAYDSQLVWPIDPYTGLPRKPFGFEANYGGQSQGLSAVGLDLFGPSDILDPAAQHPGEETPPDGLSYGILSAGYAGGGNTAVTGQFPLIKNSVVFTFTGIPAGFVASTSSITNVVFQYGTSLGPCTEPPPIPEPVTMVGMLLGIGSLVRYVRRRVVA
jgi:hypothetical protein